MLEELEAQRSSTERELLLKRFVEEANSTLQCTRHRRIPCREPNDIFRMSVRGESLRWPF